MVYDPEIHHRRSIRLPGYDYSQPGKYYVTLCTEGKLHLFGEIVEAEMLRNEWGDCVARCWKWLQERYPYVILDEWNIMPNHLHGIIVITEGRGGSRAAPERTRQSVVGALREAPSPQPHGIAPAGSPPAAPEHVVESDGQRGGSRAAPTKRKTLGSLVGAFKTVSTDDINHLRGTPGCQLWQRDFYDHIIRNDDELNKIREYIRTNPLRWDTDPDFTPGLS